MDGHYCYGCACSRTSSYRNLVKGLLPLLVVLVSALFNIAQGRLCGAGTQTSFEKVTGMAPLGLTPSPPPLRSVSTDSASPITAQCHDLCRGSRDCSAFVVDYRRGACSALGEESTRQESLVGQPRTNYFEKVCYRGLGTACGSLSWSFERSVGRELAGFDDRILDSVPSRRACQEFCLQERTFICRSGEYDYTNRQCRLSAETRRTQPAAFRPSSGDLDYFDNLCAPGVSSGCEYESQEGVDLAVPDAALSAFNEEQCRALCDSAATLPPTVVARSGVGHAFVCRSFSFVPGTGHCLLSGDDTTSAGVRSLQPRPGVSFQQRSNCLRVELECTPTAITLSLNTREPFLGRIYAKSNPGTCEVKGQGQIRTALVMPARTTTCGVQIPSPGRYTNTVVVQHHPVIQRKGDRVLQLLCIFEQANRTVTSDYRVIVGYRDSSGTTAVVNATAPSPNIRLRITDRNGNDITGTRLGEELYLRIEIDDDSVFGILARDLIATSGKKDDSIVLIDSQGCPTDSAIFPTLQRAPGTTKALQGKFDAFKFADDVVVRFEVNVQFCLQACDPVVCRDGRSSFGRRRREVGPDDQTLATTTLVPPILPDYALHREIIVEGITVTPLKDDPDIRDQIDSMSDKICTTKPILVAAILASIILQLGILATCMSCIIIHRRKSAGDDETAASVMTPFGSAYLGSLRSVQRLD